MDDVVEEWRRNAPTFLKFLESASSVSTEVTDSGTRPLSHSKTNKLKLPMAGSMLLQARCQSMTAHMYRNALVMCRGGAKRRCFQRLNRLGICISDGRALAKLKEIAQAWDSKFLKWKDDVCKQYTSSSPASGGADGELGWMPGNTESSMTPPEHDPSIWIESDVKTPCELLCSEEEEEVFTQNYK